MGWEGSGSIASKSNRYIRNGAYVAPPGKQKQTSKTITSIDDVDRASEKQKLLRRPETIEEANAHTDLDFDEAISVTHNMYKLIHGLEYYIKKYSDAHNMHYRNKIAASRADVVMQLCLLKYSVNKVAKLLDCEDMA